MTEIAEDLSWVEVVAVNHVAIGSHGVMIVVVLEHRMGGAVERVYKVTPDRQLKEKLSMRG